MNSQPEAGQAGQDHESEPGFESPRIYATSFSDYNAGIVHGAWITLSGDPDQLQAGIDQMLTGSPTARSSGTPAEEWAIHDYEGFDPLQLGEFEDIGRLSTLAAGIKEHGPPFADWVNHVGLEEPDQWDGFADAYQGRFEDSEDYGRHVCHDIFDVDPDELPGLPGLLQRYARIDLGALVRDLELSGDIVTARLPDGLHVFWNQ